MDNCGFVASPASDDGWADANRTVAFARNLSTRIVRELTRALAAQTAWDSFVAPAAGAALYPRPTAPPSAPPTLAPTELDARADQGAPLARHELAHARARPATAHARALPRAHGPTPYPSIQPTHPSPRAPAKGSAATGGSATAKGTAAAAAAKGGSATTTGTAA